MLVRAKSHLALIGIGSVLCGFSVFSIIRFTDPATAGIPAHVLLYLSLFLFCVSIFTLAGMFIRQRWYPGIYITSLLTSFRQAVLLGLLLTGSLFLQSQNLLLWWVELLFILFLLVLEVFFNL